MLTMFHTLGPREVASLSSTIITMVPTSRHVKEVYLGHTGVLEGLKNVSALDAAETLCIDESTIEQSESQNITRKIKHVGAEMIDAPVSGGKPFYISSLPAPVSVNYSVCARPAYYLVCSPLHTD